MSTNNALNIVGLTNTTAAQVTTLVSQYHTNEFRLTLTSGDPTNQAAVTAATTIYLCPYLGNTIALFNGTTWDTITSAQVSIAVPATTATNYDIFAYNNAGTLAMELTAWTNSTTRATALVYQDGVLVKSGDATRRFMGSFRTTGVSGQTESTATNRLITNYYNRVMLPLNQAPADATWTWSGTYGSWRAANGNTTTNAISVMLCDPATSENIYLVYQIGTKSNGTSVTVIVGIGLDGADPVNTRGFGAGLSTAFVPAIGVYSTSTATGYHTLLPYEYLSGSTDTVTFYKTVGIVVGSFRGYVWG